jgi:hypothetical protein
MSIPVVLNHLTFEIPEFLKPDLCKSIIQRAYDIGFHAATITSEEGTEIATNIRNNDRVIFDDIDFADELWKKVKPHFTQTFMDHKAVCMNERFRIYRYGPGQFFDWHQDGEFIKDNGLISKFTMMVYLNDGFEGGGTSFADVFSPHVFQDFMICPSIGKALFFHHPLSHRGDPISNGEKYVLRTDVMFARNTNT